MTAEPSLTGRQLGRFKIEVLLGAGGMGAVYRAFDTALDRSVAVKVLPSHLIGDESRLRRFVQEAKSASSLNHPNIITIHDVGQEDGQHFIAMELVDGETLRDRMTRRVEVKKIADIGAQIAEGLAVAHAAGIIHRDLKPENVMVSTSGFVKILDFGLAKLRDREATLDGETLVKNTTPNAVLGTPSYMSPEQASGGAVDQRSDIFAVGCMLYEMVTAQRPFAGKSVVDTLHKIINEEPRPLRELAPNAPPELQRIVRKCLAKEPDARYQSAKDLAIDLREFRRDVESDTWSGGVQPAGRLKPAAPRWWAIATAIAIAAVAVAAFLLWRKRAEPAQPAPSLQISRLTSSGNVIAAAISPDGKYIAYAYSDAGQHSLWLRQIATGSNLQLVPPARVGMWGHTFTPDGNSIYYSMKEFGATRGAGRVYEIPVIGGQPRVRVGNGVDSPVAFSPDGKRIAFIRDNHPSPSENALVIANADGSGERLLVAKKTPERLTGFFVGPSWSPDGKRIAFALQKAVSSWKLAAADVESGRETLLSERSWISLGQVAWMPDGKRLMFNGAANVSPGGMGGPNSQIWLLSVPDGAVRQITNDLFSYRNISLTADGTAMATVAADVNSAVWLTPLHGDAPPRRLTTGRFDGIGGIAAALDGTIIFGAIEANDANLWSMNSAGENRQQITSGTGPEINPAVSPDGQTVFFVAVRDGQWSIRRIGRDGSGEKELCPIIRPSVLSAAPDGKWVYFANEVDGVEAVWKVSADGGQPIRVTPYPASMPHISPDGRRLAFSLFGQPAIVVASSDGGPIETRFPVNPTTYFTFHWSADGKSLLHNSHQTDRMNVWQQPVSGGAPKQVTKFNEQYVLNFDRTPRGDALTVVRGTLSRDAVLLKGF
jgi:eukaryotic-like serine/threonine-protein kinase